MTVTRRETLQFAALISLAAHGWSGGARGATSQQAGYGTDPDLQRRPVTWQRTLDESQLSLLAALCELVLPAEPPHPSAKALGVQNFLDEWVSAPYPQMLADRKLILSGLEALVIAAMATGHPLPVLPASEQAEIFTRLSVSEATASFCRRLVELICIGYYTTREGHAAIGYVGNVPLAAFPGPPAAIVQHLAAQCAAFSVCPRP